MLMLAREECRRLSLNAGGRLLPEAVGAATAAEEGDLTASSSFSPWCSSLPKARLALEPPLWVSNSLSASGLSPGAPLPLRLVSVGVSPPSARKTAAPGLMGGM